MGHLKINDEWAIGTDLNQFILQKVKIVDKKGSKNYGKEYYTDESFHTSLTSLFAKLAQQNMLDNWPDLEKIIELNRELLKYVQDIDARLVSVGV